jgi:hypothetical protein
MATIALPLSGHDSFTDLYPSSHDFQGNYTRLLQCRASQSEYIDVMIAKQDAINRAVFTRYMTAMRDSRSAPLAFSLGAIAGLVSLTMGYSIWIPMGTVVVLTWILSNWSMIQSDRSKADHG